MSKKVIYIFQKTVAVIAILFLFLLSLDLMNGAFELIGKDLVSRYLNVESNPFVGLFIGLLVTAILQSSSTVTSMLVALVGMDAMPMEVAVPIVMGANVGTTVTSTFVALGHVSNRNEFSKAIAAASLHDFFNIGTVLILFPLEYSTQFLSKLSHKITDWLPLAQTNGANEGMFTGILPVDLLSKFLINLVGNWPWPLLILAILLLFVSLKLFSKLINEILIGDFRNKVQRYFFGNPFQSLVWGTIITGGVQSSSITSSLIVPLVAQNKVQLKNAFGFLMGSNLGTTATALLAALFNSEAAVSLALAHVMFNLIGILLFFPIPSVRNFPIYIARLLGYATCRSRVIGFVYFLFTFFGLPFLLIYFSK
ncbi:MAG: Na/Pi symporter [Flammeovirgaceae bacterium]